MVCGRTVVHNASFIVNTGPEAAMVVRLAAFGPINCNGFRFYFGSYVVLWLRCFLRLVVPLWGCARCHESFLALVQYQAIRDPVCGK